MSSPRATAPPTPRPSLTSPLTLALIDFTAPAHEVARRLIGVTLLVDGVGGRIVETEAYDQTDPASHTFGGRTARNAAMFGPPGCAYVYRSYGLHWCINTVCREAGHGAGVLLRALEPTHGIDTMRARRGLQDLRVLCAGPGRLAQALGIDASFDGRRLDLPPFQLLEPDSAPAEGAQAIDVVAGPRIGISKAVDVPWRFGLRGSRYLSRGFADASQGVAVATVATAETDVKPATEAVCRAKRGY
jgi:DNA-3-methyladenine glycosylase